MDGIAWAAGAMRAAQARLDIAAANIANGSTDGFRRQIARGSLGAGGVEISSVRDGRQGALRRTGRPSDLAIVGDGVFRIRMPDGTIAETRSGAFERDRFGHLRDARGGVLIGQRLAPGSNVRSGFLESSNVDAIGEVVDLVSAERSFEVAQKVLSAIDRTRERAATQVAQFK